MKEKLSVELFRDESQNFRSVRLEVKDDGSVKMDAQDMGKLVEKIWGDSDYEFWVDVKGTEVPKLIFALLRERYRNVPSAVDDFREFCEAHGIECTWDSWA
jgi:hypothetical protein